jgi:hypothetical protein
LLGAQKESVASTGGRLEPEPAVPPARFRKGVDIKRGEARVRKKNGCEKKVKKLKKVVDSFSKGALHFDA